MTDYTLQLEAKNQDKELRITLAPILRQYNLILSGEPLYKVQKDIIIRNRGYLTLDIGLYNNVISPNQDSELLFILDKYNLVIDQVKTHKHTIDGHYLMTGWFRCPHDQSCKDRKISFITDTDHKLDHIGFNHHNINSGGLHGQIIIPVDVEYKDIYVHSDGSIFKINKNNRSSFTFTYDKLQLLDSLISVIKYRRCLKLCSSLCLAGVDYNKLNNPDFKCDTSVVSSICSSIVNTKLRKIHMDLKYDGDSSIILT
jgi:hypothetical protein